jgi:hypothetical protein
MRVYTCTHTIFWDVTLVARWKPIDDSEEHIAPIFRVLRNVGWLSTDYTPLYCKRYFSFFIVFGFILWLLTMCVFHDFSAAVNIMYELCACVCARAALQLQHWDRGLESHWRHGCLCVFILCLRCPVTRPLPTHRTTQTQNKHTQTSMPSVGFQPTISVLERAKTFHASDRTPLWSAILS